MGRAALLHDMTRIAPKPTLGCSRALCLILSAVLVSVPSDGTAETVALWLFDEPEGLYPSSILNDASGHDLFLAFGRGGRIVPGRFGRALEPAEPVPLDLAGLPASPLFGLSSIRNSPPDRTEPLTWWNAHFCALMTAGENHLRKPPFANPTDTGLNLGEFDWTVEFWFCATEPPGHEGVVFELGRGPRGKNHILTRLVLEADRSGFRLENAPEDVVLRIPSASSALSQGWHHLAFVYSAAEQQVRHYVDGVLQPLPLKARVRRLRRGPEAYFSVGRDGRWERPLPGRLDELRFSDHQVYRGRFAPPGSFSMTYCEGLPPVSLRAGPPLLFGPQKDSTRPVALGSRKHVFIDDALVSKMEGIRFTVQPPRFAERVLDHVRGHLSLVEDEQRRLRLYYREVGDLLAVMVSNDGVHWEKPDLPHGGFRGLRNVVLPKPVGLGNVFLDPNAPPQSRWKYFSGIRGRDMFVFSSPDGWWFEPFEVAALPFAAGSQSILYYDDQRQLYVGHHRSDYARTPGGETERRFVRSETRELLAPWPWERIAPGQTRERARAQGLRPHRLDPWFLDNGPLMPPGPGVELPTALGPDPALDPPGTDIYTTKVVKYPWAPDTYLAFPAVYFHYDGDGPPERQILGSKPWKRGSGVTEVQLAVSRDGVHWKRYPRPAYVPIGSFGRNDVHMFFLTHGMVRRGHQIWQYVGGHDGNGIAYHSAWGRKGPWPLFRLVQRLDGFVAAEADYTGGLLVTHPLIFEGKRLRLNVDTGAVGYVQVGFLDEHGQPIPGYSVDECIYINGDFLDTPAEWRGRGRTVAALAGRTVQVVFRMRGAKLYAMQFTDH